MDSPVQESMERSMLVKGRVMWRTKERHVTRSRKDCVIYHGGEIEEYRGDGCNPRVNKCTAA